MDYPPLRRIILLLLPLAMIAATVAFQHIDRGPIITYVSWSIIPQTVRPGGKVDATFEVDWYRECPGIVRRKFTYSDGTPHYWDPVPAATDSDMVDLDNSRDRYELPKRRYIPRTFFVPEDTPTLRVPRGKAIYQTTIRYYCNALQEMFDYPVVVMTPPIEVEIVD